MAYTYHHGMRHIPDMVFIRAFGFPVDVGPDGEEKIRDAGISKENQQRCKCLTAPAEIACRKKRDEEVALEAKRIQDNKDATVQRRKAEDLHLCTAVCEAAGVTYSEENLAKCELKHFAKPKADQLRAFIVARMDEYPTLKSAKKLYKPPSALQDALNGTVNLISVAFGCREKKSKLLATIAAGPTELNENETESDLPTGTIITFVAQPSLNWFKSGDLLLDSGWLSRIVSVFDPKAKLIQAAVDDKLAKKATLLCSMLRQRLCWHIVHKVKSNKRDHWCLDWAKENCSIPAAYMVLFQQCKKED